MNRHGTQEAHRLDRQGTNQTQVYDKTQVKHIRGNYKGGKLWQSWTYEDRTQEWKHEEIKNKITETLNSTLRNKRNTCRGSTRKQWTLIKQNQIITDLNDKKLHNLITPHYYPHPHQHHMIKITVFIITSVLSFQWLLDVSLIFKAWNLY